MSKRFKLLLLAFVVFAFGQTTWAQTAILIRNNEPVGAYYGAASLTNAVNAAEASGDVILLSSGTFNNPGQILKSVSIYGQGWEDSETRTTISGKLVFKSNGENSLDGIHLEGVYIAEHIDLLNDNNHNPINDFSVSHIRCQGFYFYMSSNNVSIKQSLIQGTLRCYNGVYTATNFLMENCWKEGSYINFDESSSITIRNCIMHYRNITSDGSTYNSKTSYENCVIANSVASGNSTLEYCALINSSATSGTTLTNCWTGLTQSDVFAEAGVTSVYVAGVIPTVQNTFNGNDGTPIGITGGTLGWNTTPAQPSLNITTTLSQDTDGYYLVGSVADWIEFKRVIENIIPNANARMTADIDLEDTQVMVGDGYYPNAQYRRPFMGIFDGQGHTLTVHYVTESIAAGYTDAGLAVPGYLGCAPFGYVWNGTIRNLHTAGTITSVHEGTAGIVGWTNGTVLIENCHSSVNITYTNGAYSMAGITYSSYNDNHNLTIQDCIYDGTLTAGSDKRYSAGFVVYRWYGNIYIINSLLAATFANGLGNNCATFVRNGLGNGYISNSHYQTALGTVQGTQAPAQQLANGRTAFYLQNGRTELVWGQKIGLDPLPVLTNDESKRVYRSATGYTNNPAEAIDDQSIQPFAYTINNNGEITITGFDPGFTPPANYELVIPNDIDGSPVVAIANSAFRSNANIGSVTANSVTTVGEYAFEKNSSLVSITMNEVLTLQRAAFDQCTSLTTINMPKVETIADIVFGTATSLTEVSLPKAKTLGVEAFGTCANLSRVSLPEATTLGNGLFLKGYALTHTGEDGIYIPNVTTIGTYLFRSCTALTTVSMPKVTAIGTYTFDGCTALTSVDLPLITAVPERAFQNCSALSAFDHPAITSIGHYAFVNCSSLTTFSSSTVTALGNNVFEGCTNLESASFPNVTSMGTGVFHQCAALDFDQVNLSKMTSLPNYTFQSCTGITSVTLPNDRMPLVTSIGAYAFRYDTGITSVTINTAMTLGGYAFSECSNNESVSAPLVTAIPEYAFNKNTKLNTLNLPEVLTIGRNAFDYCTSLQTLSLPKVQSIGDYAFGTNSNLTEVSLPLCTTLGTEVFGTCASLTKAYMPEVTTMGIRMFYKNTSLQTLGEDAIYLPKMTTIPEGTFRECTNMLTAPLQSGITSIGNNAFYQNTNLQNVTIPASVKTIGNSAFRYCTSLNNVVLHGGLTSIQDLAFANCTGMENLTIEEGIPNINRDVFQYSGLKNVVLPSTVGAIGVNLFYQCNQLETLDVSKCVNVWELYNYTSLRGSNTIFYGVPTSTKIILPPYAHATLGANDEIATLAFDLTADSEGYYLINTADDWDKFVVYSRANPTVNGRITTDINLTSHVGKLGVGSNESNYITYKGTIDGQGHTLTIQYRTAQDVEGGLFAYVENATIQNLKVNGTITANHRLVGGFVGFVKPASTLTMQDCESNVNFTVTPSATNMHIAGFIGQGKTSTITLTDCIYSGTITGVSSFRYAAGFLGWKENPGTITYTYCLNNGTFSNTDKSYTYALGATQNSGQSTANNCYYKTGNVTNNENLAQVVSTEELVSGYVTFHLQANRLEQHWGQLLGTDPLPRLTDEEGTRVYRGQTYTNEPTSYTGLQQDADGYYLIGGTADWEEFCQVVLEFPASNARMTADVVVADNSMVGASDKKYSGIFDGQGHTLTVNYEPNGTHCAPFRYIDGATIQNLHMAGTIHTPYRYAGGLVAMSFGTSNIERCWSSVELVSTYNGDAVHSGFVACLGGGTLIINDCLFDGILTGSLAYTWGGFVGWRYNYTVNISNCLFVPQSVNVGTAYSATFSGNGGTVTNSYYTICLNNSTQGTQASEAQLESGEIAYLLQGDNADLVWGQLLGTDTTPIVTTDESRRVYDKGYNEYTNNPAEVCEIPLNFKCTSRSATTAFLEWTATDAESYEIYLTTDASDVPGKNSTTDIVCNTNSKLFTGLIAETTYYAYVRGNCGSGVGNSPWSKRCKFLPSVTQYVTANEIGEEAFSGGIPFVASYAERPTRGQYIIPASELTDVVNGEIIKLTLYGSENFTYTGGFTVSLAEVDQTTLDDGFYTGSMTSVYSGNLTIEGDDHTMDVVFSNTFTYHGNNLLVEFRVGLGGNYNFGSWKGIRTETNTAYHSHNVQYEGTYYSVEQFLPTTTITFLPEDVDQDVTGYGESTVSDHWVFIASPVKNYLAPVDVTNLIAAEETEYDLYRFNQSASMEWENYKNPTHTTGFVLENGKGYLYANKNDAELVFSGILNLNASMEVALDYDENARLAGYNLVGNPFSEVAYIDRTYYKMNDDGDDVEAVENYNEEAIPACTGVVVVAASDDEKVTFSKATPATSTGNNGSLQMTLTKAGTRGNAFQDKAIVSFNEGARLGKYIFNENHAKLYIPQGGKDYAIVSVGRDGVHTVSTEVPINFKASKNGEYTITVNPEGVEMEYLHLIDNMTGADIDLLHPNALIAGEDPQSPAPSYTFTARTTDYESRFKLVFSANNGDGPSTGSGTFAFFCNGQYIIANPSTGSGSATLQVIDLTGRILSSETINGYVSKSINQPAGVYMLRLINGEDVKVQKIVVR